MTAGLTFKDISPSQPGGSEYAFQAATSNSWSVPSPVETAAYAGFWLRFAAQFIDGLILTAASWVVAIGFSMLLLTAGASDEAMESSQGLFFMAWLCGHWLYFALFESSSWQATLGKRATGIIVTDLDGQRLTFGRATGRYWSKWLSYLTFLVGFLIAAFTSRKQALHDLIANTLVLRR
jgi:uncharacterized RDD family membrane protein YckC